MNGELTLQLFRYISKLASLLQGQNRIIKYSY